MQTKLDAHNLIDHRQTFSRGPLALRKQQLILSAIGMLSDREIRMMNRNALLDALRMAQLASPESEAKNIDRADVAELRRFLAIVRDYFRNQVDRRRPEKAWSPEFN